MSLKYQAQLDGPNKYVLEKVGDMKCDVIAFLFEALYEASDDKMWDDAVCSASMEGATGMYLMPDCHGGYVLPVGGVLVTEGTIVQAGSGYDIGCGCCQLKLIGLHASDIVDWDVRERWVKRVEHFVATGNHRDLADGMKLPSDKKINDVLYWNYRELFLEPFLKEIYDGSLTPEFEAIRSFITNLFVIGKSIEPFGHEGKQWGDIEVFRLFREAFMAVSDFYEKKEADYNDL